MTTLGLNLAGLWLAMCFICLAAIIEKVVNWNDKSRRMTRLGWTIALLSIPVLTAPLYYEFSTIYNTPVTFENGRAVVRPLGAFAWEFGSGFANLPTSLPISVYGDVRSITPNPKVRELSYQLQVTISDLDRFFADAKNRRLGMSHTDKIYGTSFSQFSPGDPPRDINDRIGMTTLDLLYRFNDAHSKELAEFYNPLDAEQLRALKALVEPWVNERLAARGLRAELQSFTVK